MSLATRLIALAQAIGADVKAVNAGLNTKAEWSAGFGPPDNSWGTPNSWYVNQIDGSVWNKGDAWQKEIAAPVTASVVTAYNNPANPTVVSANLAPNTWGLLPFPNLLTISVSDGSNPDFTRNADGSLTINKSGNYILSACVGSFSNVFPGGTGSSPVTLDMRFVLTAANKAGSPDQTDSQIVTQRDLAPGGEYAIRSFSTEFVATVGQKIGCMGFHSSTAVANLGLMNIGISRAGAGPVGPPGAAGPAGPMVEYGAWTNGMGAAGVAPTATFTLLPTSAITTRSGTAAEFVRNADGSVTVQQTGIYTITAGCYCDQLANSTILAMYRLTVMNNNAVPDGNIVLERGSAPGPYGMVPLSWTGLLQANQRLSVWSWHNDAAARSMYLEYFGISRTGSGPVGPQGPTGGMIMPSPSTVPPAAPVDGQLWMYPFDNTGVNWMFRYNAASTSAFKWEYVGGVEAAIQGQGSGNVTSAALTPFGSGLVLPRAGDYRIDWGGLLSRGTPSEWLYVYFAAGDGTINTTLSQWLRSTEGSPELSLQSAQSERVNNVAAGGTWKLRLSNSNGTSIVTCTNGWMTIKPIRVS